MNLLCLPTCLLILDGSKRRNAVAEGKETLCFMFGFPLAVLPLQNEELIASAIGTHGIPRDEVFITSKVSLFRPVCVQGGNPGSVTDLQNSELAASSFLCASC